MNTFGMIATTSGVTTVILGSMVFLLKQWFMTRLEESIKHEYDNKLLQLSDELHRKTDIEIEHVKAELMKEIELQRLRLGPYSEKQFEIYNSLWKDLNSLKYSMNRLWEGATKENFREFSELLDETTIRLENSALLFQEKHYNEMISIMNEFWNLQLGKKSLMVYRESHLQPNSKVIADMINDNRVQVNTLQDNIRHMMALMRGQISNWIDAERTNAAEQMHN